MSKLRSVLALSPAKITASYVVFGVVWMLVSDRIVNRLFESSQLLARMHTLKGWVFVGLSGALIFGLTTIRREQVAETEARLRESNQQLQVFHRVFRHNVRNNVNVFRGYLDVVGDHLDEESLQSHLDSARRKAAELVTISEKLRIINSVEATGSMDKRVNLVALVESELVQFRSEHPEVTVETDLPEAAWIVGDDGLQHAIREILANTVIHRESPLADCRIDVSISTVDSQPSVTITDNGPGIPPAELAAIREGEETQLVHASGVGLWLVNWLCHLYDGEVHIDSESAEGASVTLQFQAASGMPEIENVIEGAQSLGRGSA